jgi:hypothetical protein
MKRREFITLLGGAATQAFIRTYQVCSQDVSWEAAEHQVGAVCVSFDVR